MNKFEHNEDGTTTIYIESKTYGTKEVLIDTEDWDKVKKYRWNVNKNARAKANDVFYVVSTSNAAIEDYQRSVKFHRVIMDCHDERVVDHINGLTLDNRKVNLRITTQQENKWNRPKPSNGKNKYIGVFKSGNRWGARIGSGRGQHRYLGLFDTPEEAAIARDEEVARARTIVNPQNQFNFPENWNGEEYKVEVT